MVLIFLAMREYQMQTLLGCSAGLSEACTLYEHVPVTLEANTNMTMYEPMSCTDVVELYMLSHELAGCGYRTAPIYERVPHVDIAWLLRQEVGGSESDSFEMLAVPNGDVDELLRQDSDLQQTVEGVTKNELSRFQ